MKGSIKLFKVRGISINVHITFFLLLLLFLTMGFKWLFLIVGIFCFVTLHELCHSMAAQKFGIRVKEITLLPIGGIASMTKMPDKPSQEFFISIVGPLFNIGVVLVFYFPLYFLVGPDVLHRIFIKGPSLATWADTIVYIYWLNLILAVFNLIPAFPMDGGRILRSILARRMGYQKATKIAVNFGHIFALLFGYIGLVHGHIILIIIAVFIYMAASGEETQVDIKETLKKFVVKDILSKGFLTLTPDALLSKVLELIFHSHQEDFPVMELDRMAGFITRADVINAVHQFGMQAKVSDIMRKSVPFVNEYDSLDKAQNIMQESGIKALPVMRLGRVIGVITLEDISRIYTVMSVRK